MKELLELSQFLIFPAFGYIIVLERRITKLQTQIEMFLASGVKSGK